MSSGGRTRLPGRLRAAGLASLRMLLLSLAFLASVTTADAHDPDEDDDADLCLANGGPFGVPGLQDPPSVIGEWEELTNWTYIGLHASLLHSGKVMRHRRATAESAGDGNGTTLWHPSTPSVLEDLPGNAFPHPDSTVMGNPPDPGDLFCSGHTPLTDGRVLVVGGGGTLPSVAADRSYIFDGDPASGGNPAFPWIRVSDMAFTRWYPTATSLPDGRVLVTGGSGLAIPGQPTTCCVDIFAPEVYQPVDDTWITLPVAPSDPRTYPRMYVLPEGLVLNTSRDKLQTLDPATGTWDLVADTPTEFMDDEGTGAMYRPGKVLVVGGRQTDPDDWSTNNRDQAQVLDATLPKNQWAWRHVPSMAFKRRRADTVLLPDGKVLVIGGLAQSQQAPECAVHAAELWDPAAEVFTQLASQVHPRLYHSTALLLQDARVLTLPGEDKHLPTDHYVAEIFSPPYLFQGPRPTVQSAPRTASYGEIIRVDTPDATSIGLVTFLRPGSVTHNNDMSQRYMELGFVQAGGGLDVTMPDANLAPPGEYMLFLVDTSGVPSVATFVRMMVDRDGDGFLDDGDVSLTEGDLTCDEQNTIDCDDNCPLDANPLQIDTDLDTMGNVCDDDDDNDGFSDDEEIAAGTDPLDPLSAPHPPPQPPPPASVPSLSSWWSLLLVSALAIVGIRVRQRRTPRE